MLHISRVFLFTIWAILHCCVFVVGVRAADAGNKEPEEGQKTPLFGLKHPFQIFVANNPALREAIAKELKQQREDDDKYQLSSTLRTSSGYDQQFLNAYLRSQGYYAARIDSRVNNGQILHQIYTDRRFRVEGVVFAWPDNIEPPQLPELIKAGDYLVAERVLDSLSLLEEQVRASQCFRKVAMSYDVVVRHPTASAIVTFALEPSPQVAFGELNFHGGERIREDFLRRVVPFKQGDCFKRRLVDSARLALLKTNLLASVEPEIGDITADAQVPITFRLVERKRRSVGAGIGYDSDTKTRYTASWQHRNLRGRGEQLTTELSYSDLRSGADAELIVPRFFRSDQRLTLEMTLAEETTDAFDLYEGTASAIVERDINRYWTVGLGTSLAFSRVKEALSEDDFALLGFPIVLDYATRDDPLNPRSGITAGIELTPFTDLYNSDTRFTRNIFGLAGYYTQKDWRYPTTFAMRFSAGILEDASPGEVPRDHLFYVGGGGSVRGYNYQTVGEFNAEGEPAGGLSYSETALEFRVMATDNIGVTLFTDGGYAYPTKSPKFGDNYLWGAGLGVRYHTSFAPFRFDIATPLTTRRDAEGNKIDDSVHVYIGIGQSF